MTIRTLPALSCLLVCSVPFEAVADDEIRVANIEDLAFETTPEGVAFASLEGERFKEAYMAMVRLPAGTESPLHIKTADMFGIVVAGEMTHSYSKDSNEDAKTLATGAYYHIPANLPHVSRCVSEVECVTFLYQDGAFDFVPVQDEKSGN
ncbi:DUF4437 domain-containing protein [Gimibacter soli]|uniref:DUF4437 domain-containing protein n=1 Tax=Gimibacter soli TaxID=3024400 RepID=A0AAE9XV88_9PROT|nr:DUF4437 domain-containing protein [Gimibacter soli]WCL53469.1 DUF4437 domain-containing protein [Gimibacter soli]